MARLLFGFFGLLTLMGVLLTAERANALLTDIAETGEPGLLVLRADPHPFHWQNPGPGETKHWLIEASLTDAEVGSLSLEMRAYGDLVTDVAMTVSVSSCSVPFSRDAEGAPPHCAGTMLSVLPVTPIREIATKETGQLFPLADLRAGDPRNLLVTLGIPADATRASLRDASANLSIGLHASGDSAAASGDTAAANHASPGVNDSGPPVNDSSPPANLAETGANALALLVIVFGLTGMGLSVHWFRALRSREEQP